jgi:protein involved in polysaccharide export with SLBB domain
VIYVPSTNRSWINENRASTVRVLGAVNTQGRYRFDKSMTILDLLAQAGGLSASAESSNIVVVNVDCCERKKVQQFDLIEFSETGDFNQLPRLNSGDTVYVMHKADSTWNRVMENIQETISVISILKILGGT